MLTLAMSIVRVCDEPGCGSQDDVKAVVAEYHPHKTRDLCRACREAAELRRLAQEARKQ